MRIILDGITDAQGRPVEVEAESQRQAPLAGARGHVRAVPRQAMSGVRGGGTGRGCACDGRRR